MQVAAALRSIETAPATDPVATFDETIAAIAAAHRPSRMPFFARLAALPREVVSDPDLLGRLHLVYQAAMHATRVAVYHLPHLDSPALRRRKVAIFIDDDGLPGGDTHHYQLTRAFRSIGANCVIEDEAFGDIEELCEHLDPATARFARLAATLYARSLGAWCIVEMLSVDWLRALADGLGTHFPSFPHEPYFAECLGNEVEEHHAAEALDVTRLVLAKRPDRLSLTLNDAERMAEALDGVWAHLDSILQQAIATARPNG